MESHVKSAYFIKWFRCFFCPIFNKFGTVPAVVDTIKLPFFVFIVHRCPRWMRGNKTNTPSQWHRRHPSQKRTHGAAYRTRSFSSMFAGESDLSRWQYICTARPNVIRRCGSKFTANRHINRTHTGSCTDLPRPTTTGEICVAINLFPKRWPCNL